MRNVSDKSCRENQNIHFVFSKFLENFAVYEEMRQNNVERDRLQMAIWRMRIACWIPKATHTHTHTHTHRGCVTLIAFPLPQWWHEHTSVLRYT